jgi:hypothetical protein
MQKAYKVLAFLIAVEVMVQAAVMVWAIFGLGYWIENDNGVLNKAVLDDTSGSWHFTAERGFMYHGINGQMIIPLIALILLIVSFFAKIPGGVKFALTLVVLIVIQVLLGIFGHDQPNLAPLHGINALLIFGAAIMAGKRVGAATSEPDRVAAGV